jgi:hypothetical protein
VDVIGSFTNAPRFMEIENLLLCSQQPATDSILILIQSERKLSLKFGEIYCEAMRQDTKTEHLDIKLQLSDFILPLRGIRYMHEK